MKAFYLCLITSLALVIEAQCADHYVATNGVASGTGGYSHPWSLRHALDNSTVEAGDTIWLRGGTYTGYFISTLTGTSGRPIKVRQYPGERAIIDGECSDRNTFTVDGSYTWYMDFEIASSCTKRVSAQSGSWPTDVPAVDAIHTANGTGNKFINLYIHDVPQGIGAWKGATDVEIHGCVFYAIGWNAPDRTHGHALYTQGAVTIENVIACNGAANGGQIYGTDKASLDGSTVRNSIWFDTGTLFGDEGGQDLLVGGQAKTANLTVTGNAVYRKTGGGRSNFYIGYTGGTVGLTLTNNIVASPVLLNIGRDSINNANQWLTTKPSTGNAVKVYQNRHDTHRWHLAIYNWAKATTVTIPAPTGLTTGDTYILRNAQNYHGDTMTGTVANASLVIPMTGRTVAPPVGVTPGPPTSFPAFGAFILTKIGSAGTAAAPLQRK